MKRPPKYTGVIFISALILGAGSYVLGWSAIFTVREVAIAGAPTKESQLAVSRAVDISRGEKLARLDPRALSARLKSFDWIDSSEISRNWVAGKINIAIKVRTPIAIYSEPGKPQVALDASGKTFAAPTQISQSLPRISANSVESGLAVIKLFTQLPKNFSEKIDLISATRADNYVIHGEFSGQKLRIIWGNSADTSLKVEVIDALLQREENKNLRMIDVSAPHAPIVK